MNANAVVAIFYLGFFAAFIAALCILHDIRVLWSLLILLFFSYTWSSGNKNDEGKNATETDKDC